jgi:hypothetical protein
VNVTLKNLTDFILYAGAVAAALTAIGLVMRYVVLRPLQRWITEQITQRLAKPLDRVQTEMVDTGNGSIKSAVKRTETKVDQLTERFDRHLESHGK